jgi:phage/plasmid-like protein (TIGR03299 family)
MSHSISEASGRPEMFYVGERPWHGLGTELQAPATAAEAIAAAGLDWDVAQQPLFTKAGEESERLLAVEIMDHVANVRQDTGHILGVVGKRYQPIQNREAFTFFDAVVGQGQAIYHTAGALGGGERVWILAKLPEDIVIRRQGTEDRTERFLLLSNSHNGWSSLRMFFTPIRVVCQNTLNAALSRKPELRSGIRIQHSGEIKHKVSEAQRALGLAVKFYDDLAQLTEALASRTLKAKELEQYVAAVFPSKEQEPSPRVLNVRKDVLHLVEHGQGNNRPGIRGTAWAALNGVVEYVDHERPGRGKTQQEQASSRLESAWFGYGATIKARAWDEAVALVK